jgi:uncharacterized protein involved in exopolysaccharide biosynthesis
MRRGLLTGIVIGVAVAVVLRFTLPRREASEFAFIVDADQSAPTSGVASLIGLVGGGRSSSPEFYAYLATSDELLYHVACRLAKQPPDICDSDKFERKPLAKTVARLRRKVSAAVNRGTGVVSVRVIAPADSEAVSTADAVLETLDVFDMAIRRSRASVEVAVASRQRDSARADLARAEDELRNFLEENRARGRAPRLLVDQDRLERRLTLANQLYLGLARDAQQAELKKTRDTPVITLLQRPRIPTLRVSPPSLTILLLGMALLGGLTGALYELLRTRRDILEKIGRLTATEPRIPGQSLRV